MHVDEMPYEQIHDEDNGKGYPEASCLPQPWLHRRNRDHNTIERKHYLKEPSLRNDAGKEQEGDKQDRSKQQKQPAASYLPNEVESWLFC